tara:strand:- start:101 stop:520 length:420 start_codon:yes stop_codon:yes gene_type:complete
MRTYLAKIKIPDNIKKQSVGYIGEKVFEHWFKANYNDEQLFKQKADRDYNKIDYADEKGFKYQVKTTSKKSYTFNCSTDKINNHLTSDYYIFVQLKNNYAYIENFRTKQYILDNIIQSFKYKNSSYVKPENLLQEVLSI